MSVDNEQPQNLATAITEISERAMLLVREEIELAKAEMSEKFSRVLRAIVVGLAAGIFIVVGLLFVLHGVAWVFFDQLFNQVAWGYFIVGGGLLVLAFLAGLIAAKAMKSSVPPTPELAINEARKIKETVEAAAGVSKDDDQVEAAVKS